MPGRSGVISSKTLLRCGSASVATMGDSRKRCASEICLRLTKEQILILLLSALSITPAISAREVTVRVLATTDLHGNIFPYDYYTAKPMPRGLAKIATLIAQE